MVNTGTLTVTQSVTVDGTAQFTGGGTVVLAGTSSVDQVDGNSNDPAGSDSLINVDNIITGTGYIGGNGQAGLLSIINESIIEASGGGNYLILEPDQTGGIVNSGTIEAINGGALGLGFNEPGGETLVNNNSGSIIADGSQVNLDSVQVNGGNIVASNGGRVSIGFGCTVENASISLSGDNSSIEISAAVPEYPPTSFQNVSFSGDPAATGEYFFLDASESGTTPSVIFDNVSFLNQFAFSFGDGEGANIALSGTITNTGSLNFGFGASASLPDITINGQVTLTGGGTLDLSGGYAHAIDGSQNDPLGTDTLINANNTITGSGDIGGVGTPGRIEVINEGVIQANSGDNLFIDPDLNRGVLNSGTIEAINGGYVGFPGATNSTDLSPINNTSGLIVASGTGAYSNYGYGNLQLQPVGVPSGFPTSSVVELSAVNLTGGKLAACNGGLLVLDSSSTISTASISLFGSYSQVFVGSPSPESQLTPVATFNNVSFSSDPSATDEALWVFGPSDNPDYGAETTFNNVSFLNNLAVELDGATAVLSGTINNTGSITLNDPTYVPQGTGTYIGIGDQATLTGGGTINLNGGAYIDSVANFPSTVSLTNLNNTITGSGSIGDRSGLTQITNQGIIQADSGTLAVEPNFSFNIVNSGTLQAINGGSLEIAVQNSNASRSTLNNSSGFIIASGSGSLVEMEGFPIQGGNLVASGGGTIDVGDGLTLENVSVSLVGNNSQFHSAFAYFGADVGFDNVSFTGDPSATGQGLWVNGEGNLENVSFLGGLPVNLVDANVIISGPVTNTGSINFDDPNNPSGDSTIVAINGTVTLQGGGIVNLVNNGSSPGHIIDGDRASGGSNVLINKNNTITGTGFVGGTPDTAGSVTTYSSAMTFINCGTVLAGAGDDLTLVSSSSAFISNEGVFSVNAGGVMTIQGNYNQASTGSLGVDLGGAVAASGGNLGLAGTYSHLDVTGNANLDGTFQVSLSNGFAPQLGDVFDVLNYQNATGQFSNYLGLRLANNLVLDPTYTSNALLLTVANLSPGTTAPLQPVAAGSPVTIAAGSTYAGLIATSPLNTANHTVATVLDGAASASTSVSMSFQPAGNFAAPSGGPLYSDIVNFQGTGSDVFVLQIDFNPAALAAGENEENLFLAWLDPATGGWENAVLGNTGDSVPQEIIGAYNPATDFALGDYGVDPVDGRVWAVLDHNSEFAAAPEPATWVLLTIAGAVFMMRRRRIRPS